MEAAIELDRVSKSLGGREILKGVSFSVGRGDIFGYLGPNGAGKTTTIRIILGLLRATSGRASILGSDVKFDASRERLGFVLEADGLYDSMSAQDNLAYYARIYGVPAPGPTIERLLGSAGLAERAGDRVASYSKGMRQRLALARATVHDPEVLILDEPTAGVDPSGQIEVRRLILDMAHKEGKTIFFSSHNLDEVERICNRIALIDRGEIRLYGELSEMQRQAGGGEVVIETAEPLAEAVYGELQDLPQVTVRERKRRGVTLAFGGDRDVAGIIAFLAQRGARIEQVIRREASLEELYTAILKEAGQD